MNIDGAELKVLVNEQGPLPLKAQITPVANLPEPVFISGSCSAAENAQQVGFELYIAGELVGQSVVYADKANEHKTTVPVILNCNIPFNIENGKVQPVDIELKPLAGTETDSNDVFNVTILT